MSDHTPIEQSQDTEHLDVVVVGAGISGIGAAYYLQTMCPDRSYAILEGRDVLGGTWDLFRYPGIRSDSDMYTLGFSFDPWADEESIAPGGKILDYLHRTTEKHGIDAHIRYGHMVTAASWSSEEARWTLSLDRSAKARPTQITCNFLFVCGGYYDYREGYTPEFPGVERFEGALVHPQQWTEDIDYTGKQVVVIGSGATAVTLVPELAAEAEHVVMLQRSPTYVVSAPGRDPVATALRGAVPPRVAHTLTRSKNVLLQMVLYNLARLRPEKTRQLVMDRVREHLGEDYDVERHFGPSYDPWDQRVCLVPDGDLFEVIKSGRASVVTDHIETFTETGIQLQSGQELEADLIVTATGLKLRFLGGLQLTVDGETVDPAATTFYKAMMMSDVPNLAMSFGYTNASWTLRSEMTCQAVCRLLNQMRQGGFERCVPRLHDPNMARKPFLDFSSGYVQRSIASWPKQGVKGPWRVFQNYLRDRAHLRYGDRHGDALEMR